MKNYFNMWRKSAATILSAFVLLSSLYISGAKAVETSVATQITTEPKSNNETKSSEWLKKIGFGTAFLFTVGTAYILGGVNQRPTHRNLRDKSIQTNSEPTHRDLKDESIQTIPEPTLIDLRNELKGLWLQLQELRLYISIDVLEIRKKSQKVSEDEGASVEDKNAARDAVKVASSIYKNSGDHFAGVVCGFVDALDLGRFANQVGEDIEKLDADINGIAKDISENKIPRSNGALRIKQIAFEQWLPGYYSKGFQRINMIEDKHRFVSCINILKRAVLNFKELHGQISKI